MNVENYVRLCLSNSPTLRIDQITFLVAKGDIPRHSKDFTAAIAQLKLYSIVC